MKLAQLMQNKKFKGFLTMLYSLGASVVVLGALFKIQHWPGAGFMLSAGLITEALIFFIYAFEKDEDTAPENENITTSVTDGDEFLSGYGITAGEAGAGFPALLKFDRMLEETDITPDMLFRLGEGMRKLGETTENMSAMVDISAASTQYLKTIKRADESLLKTAKSYETVISNVTVKTVFKYKSIANSLSNIETGSIEFQQQMKSLNKNLSSLNNTFRLQQKSSEDFLKDQEACAAESKKYRDETGLFVAEGVKLISDLSTAFHCELLLYTPQREIEVRHLQAGESIPVDEKELHKISTQKSPQGMLAVFRKKTPVKITATALSGQLCLALDDIQDPGNLGTIIRIADWFGIKHIFCSTATADAFNPKTVQATMGALSRVELHYVNLPEFLSEMKDIPVYGTFLDGTDLYTRDLTPNGIIVMGNEGKGISPEIAQLVTGKLMIPNYPKDAPTSESLNVAVATAIVCGEFRRRG